MLDTVTNQQQGLKGGICTIAVQLEATLKHPELKRRPMNETLIEHLSRVSALSKVIALQC